MVAVTLMSALLGTLEPVPSVERLAELLEAANRPLAQLTGVSRSTMRGGLGNGPVEEVLLRMEEDSFGDGSHVVYVNRVLLKERSFTDWTDTVTGRNADYTFKLSREPGETKWQLESVRPTDVGEESTNASGVRYYLFGWVNKRTLPDLLGDGTIEKTVVPLPGGGWLIDGRTGHETGLLSFRTRVKATDKYAYVVWASCRLATRDGGVDEHESEVRVQEDVLPIPE